MKGTRIPDPHGRRAVSYEITCPFCRLQRIFFPAVEPILLPATLQDELVLTARTENKGAETEMVIEVHRSPAGTHGAGCCAMWRHVCKGVYRP